MNAKQAMRKARRQREEDAVYASEFSIYQLLKDLDQLEERTREMIREGERS